MSGKRTRGSTCPRKRSLPIGDDTTTTSTLNLKRNLTNLVARKSKNSKHLAAAAKYLATIGLEAYVPMLDEIKEDELDEKIDILEGRTADEDSAYKKRKIEQQSSDAYTNPVEHSLVEVSFVVPSAVASLRQLTTAVPIVDVALIEALEYLGELKISNTVEEELYCSLKRNVKRDPEEGVLRNHIAAFLRSKLQNSLSSASYAPIFASRFFNEIYQTEHNPLFMGRTLTLTEDCTEDEIKSSKESAEQDRQRMENDLQLCLEELIACLDEPDDEYCVTSDLEESYPIPVEILSSGVF